MQPRHRYRMTALLAGLTICVVGVWTWMHNASRLDGTSLQQKVLSIASELHTPGDRNSMTVANSSLPAAQDMKFQIQQYLIEGKTKPQILGMMVNQYGTSVLAAPRNEGIGSLVWLLPWVALGVIGMATIVYIRRSSLAPRRIRESNEEAIPSTAIAIHQERDGHSQHNVKIEQKIQEYM